MDQNKIVKKIQIFIETLFWKVMQHLKQFCQSYLEFVSPACESSLETLGNWIRLDDLECQQQSPSTGLVATLHFRLFLGY